jgi:hypothetical protein
VYTAIGLIYAGLKQRDETPGAVKAA